MFCGANRGDAQDCIQWAIDALCAGADSPTLRILAGLTPPLYSYEVREYATKALKEVGIEIPTGKDAVSAYARNLIEDIVVDPACMQDRLHILSSPQRSARTGNLNSTMAVKMS